MNKDLINNLDPDVLNRDQHRILHLDSEYRNKWALFMGVDGSLLGDSRTTNWRHVAWEKVHKIIVNIKGREHAIPAHPRDHKFFFFFRAEGRETVYDLEEAERIRQRQAKDPTLQARPDRERRMIRHWTVGPCDGRTAFLIDIDFRTGAPLRGYTLPVSSLLAHIHPRIQALNHLHRMYSGAMN